MSNEDPMPTIEKLLAATNAHDVEGIVSCFAADYVLESPAHPARSFRGKDQVRRNWTQILGGVPDLKATVVGFARNATTAWTEWDMAGTRRDGKPHRMRGVFVFGVSEGLLRWGRMFLEPVEEGGGDADAAVRSHVGGGA